jgi:cytochrome P450
MASRAASAPAADKSKATKLPAGPRLPGPAQTVYYTFWQVRFFEACRARFGATWTLRLPGFPPIVVTGDRDAIRRMLTGDPLLRHHGNDLLREFLGERSLMMLEPAEHLARRRVELPPFHGEAVRSYADRIGELVGAELQSWEAGSVVATHPRARTLTLSIILELVLGVRDAHLRTELASLFDWFAMPRNNLGLFLPRALTRRAWWNVAARPAYARLDRIRALLSAHIQRTREDPALDQRRDVLALLVRARDDDGAGLSDVDLRDELVTLVTAGHETTATAIAWGCDLLAHNPSVAQRLRETVVSGQREYLQSTIKEMLRVRTVAYVAAGRHCLEPFAVGDWVLGPEVLILVDAQGVHGDPELYPNPHAFRPERFLEGQPNGYTYIPFGGGAHRCLGAALATLELELFFETLARVIELAPTGPPAHPIRRGVALAPSNGGRVRVISERSLPHKGTSRAARERVTA